MKKIVSISISLFICLASLAQKQSEKEVKSLLCHKWKIDYAKAGDERFPLPPGLGSTFLDIKSNGTVIAGDPNKQKQGKWRYDHKTKTLTTETGSNSLKHEIIKITKTSLVLKSTIETIQLDIVMKRVD